MNGAATVDIETRHLVSVSLSCIWCGAVEEIHVFEERRLPGEMYWECFNCQKRDGRLEGWPKSG